MTYAEHLKHCSMDEAVEIIRDASGDEQIVRDALTEFFQRGVSAGVDAERVIIKDALLDYFARRDAAGALVNPEPDQNQIN